MKPKISLGMSPCPNDTFMFYHLLHHSDFSKKYDIDLQIMDIQDLNELLKSKEVDFCKSSFGLIPKVLEDYVVLRSGSALGHACGPLLVSKNKAMTKQDLLGSKILIPGLDTSAFSLLRAYLGSDFNAEECLFSEIMPALGRGEADAGLIIHESRFTYEDFALSCLVDLGEWWEQKYSLPIPLGAISAKRYVGNEVIEEFSNALKASVEWAFSQDWKENKEFSNFICGHAKEISEEVLDSHIALYVNQESIELSEQAIGAIEKMFSQLKNREISRSEFLFS
ncbi:1,4-dihydroxy-6-naphthoate synthase [Lentisphaera profundi]|uniref:1,4-dihydroxy-6-naphtoate synthase n=1 Tax=Lentisphaera profundi TaxID=1658616 RepID=A0ABY7VRZ9_9BACT|nr:1,4-dihydroxy-6-naphthoate synthase [Lentisphaera profundi]WDE96981.1 1,4-dihydroxy-6-naphthoate synthase [Lentisphaera profundi]